MLNKILLKVFYLTWKGILFNMVLEHLLKTECAVLCDIRVSLQINKIEKFNKLVIKNSNER